MMAFERQVRAQGTRHDQPGRPRWRGRHAARAPRGRRCPDRCRAQLPARGAEASAGGRMTLRTPPMLRCKRPQKRLIGAPAARSRLRAQRGCLVKGATAMPFRPPIHRPQGWRPPEQVRQRGSASSRGYDRDWQVLRLLHLQCSPLCVSCAKQGRAAAATVVDHVRPFKGRDDPLRMDPTNLESLCHPCHARKTNRDGSIPRFKSR